MIEARKAPAGMFRILGIDKFSDEHWIEGDYQDKKYALELADKKTKEAKPTDSPRNNTGFIDNVLTVYYVYDDTGKYLGPQ